MLEATYWQYEKLQADGKIKIAPLNDADAKITGRHVFGLKAWFDENPAEARRLGWVKHIMHNPEKYVEWNRQTQYLQKRCKIIDEYTFEDEYIVCEKTESMMRKAEEQGSGYSYSYDNGVIWEDDF